MENQEVSLKLTVAETNFLLQVMGELPSKSGAFPLMMKVKGQADAQIAPAAAPVAAAA